MLDVVDTADQTLDNDRLQTHRTGVTYVRVRLVSASRERGADPSFFLIREAGLTGFCSMVLVDECVAHSFSKGTREEARAAGFGGRLRRTATSTDVGRGRHEGPAADRHDVVLGA